MGRNRHQFDLAATLANHYNRAYPSRMVALSLILSLLLTQEYPGLEYQERLSLWLGALPFIIGYFALLLLAQYLRTRYLHTILSRPVVEVIFLLVSYLLLRGIVNSAYRGSSEISYLTDLLPALLIFIPWAWAHVLGLFGTGRGTPTGILLGLFTLALGLEVAFFLYPGSAKSLYDSGNIAPDRVQEPIYEEEVFFYGSEGDLDLGTTNLAPLVKMDEKQDAYRRKHLGYDRSMAPYVGQIYLPKGAQAVPFLLFVHGNHNLLADNGGGYDYLGRFLARQGFGFVSVDQSLLNASAKKGVSGENDARAAYLLRHLEALLKENEREGSPLYHRLDGERILIGGHSRGGEAATIAAYYLEQGENPDGIDLALTFDYEIQGVLAVAPTSDQYNPANHPLHLSHTSYLLLHGINDQDVTTIQGLSQYSRVEPRPGQFKAFIYGEGLNHAHFNGAWGSRDKPYPYAAFYERNNLLTQRDQEQVLQTYALAFLRIIDDSDVPKAILHQEAYLPKVKYYTRFYPGESLLLAGFEEDSALTTATHPQVVIDGSALSLWREGAFPYGESALTGEHVLTARMGPNSGLTFLLEPGVSEYASALHFDVAFEGEVVGLQVTLRDGEGREVVVPVADYKTLLPPMETTFLKWEALLDQSQKKNGLQSVVIPFDQLAEDFDDQNITEITFTTEKSALLYLDDVSLQ